MAIIFHLCAFAAVFDIYFRSPIVNGMEQIALPPGHKAKRIVIIIADGGRADMFFDETSRNESLSGDGPLAPFIRSKILRGETSWGVSHTRVPTESRPCHASLLGGVYEDPSAVTKGWQENPVEFDSVINGSSAGFCFGSPDLVPLFCKDLKHVVQEVYPAEWEDFASGCDPDSQNTIGSVPGKVPPPGKSTGSDNSTQAAGDQGAMPAAAQGSKRGCRRLDDWVFTQMEQLLHNASVMPALDARLRGDGVVMFLHLLGLDMNGHAHRPKSAHYRANVASVDRGVERLEQMLGKFYADNATAFVFTVTGPGGRFQYVGFRLGPGGRVHI